MGSDRFEAQRSPWAKGLSRSPKTTSRGKEQIRQIGEAVASLLHASLLRMAIKMHFLGKKLNPTQNTITRTEVIGSPSNGHEIVLREEESIPGYKFIIMFSFFPAGLVQSLTDFPFNGDIAQEASHFVFHQVFSVLFFVLCVLFGIHWHVESTVPVAELRKKTAEWAAVRGKMVADSEGTMLAAEDVGTRYRSELVENYVELIIVPFSFVCFAKVWLFLHYYRGRITLNERAPDVGEEK